MRTLLQPKVKEWNILMLYVSTHTIDLRRRILKIWSIYFVISLILFILSVRYDSTGLWVFFSFFLLLYHTFYFPFRYVRVINKRLQSFVQNEILKDIPVNGSNVYFLDIFPQQIFIVDANQEKFQSTEYLINVIVELNDYFIFSDKKSGVIILKNNINNMDDFTPMLQAYIKNKNVEFYQDLNWKYSILQIVRKQSNPNIFKNYF